MQQSCSFAGKKSVNCCTSVSLVNLTFGLLSGRTCCINLTHYRLAHWLMLVTVISLTVQLKKRKEQVVEGVENMKGKGMGEQLAASLVEI